MLWYKLSRENINTRNNDFLKEEKINEKYKRL